MTKNKSVIHLAKSLYKKCGQKYHRPRHVTIGPIGGLNGHGGRAPVQLLRALNYPSPPAPSGSQFCGFEKRNKCQYKNVFVQRRRCRFCLPLICLPRVDRCRGRGRVAPALIRFPTEVLMPPMEWRWMVDVAPYENFRSDTSG